MYAVPGQMTGNAVGDRDFGHSGRVHGDVGLTPLQGLPAKWARAMTSVGTPRVSGPEGVIVDGVVTAALESVL